MYNEWSENPHRSRRGGRGDGRRGGHGGPGGPGSRGGRFRGDPYYGSAQADGPWPESGRRRGGGTRLAVLTLLKGADGPRTGYQITQELDELGYGRRTPGPARVYPALQQLEDEGLVRGAPAETGTGRAYALTDDGTEYLNSLGTAAGSPWPNEGRAALRQAIFSTVTAVRQVALDGSPEASAKAAELLSETRKGLYRLLAGDTESGSTAELGSTAESSAGQ